MDSSCSCHSERSSESNPSRYPKEALHLPFYHPFLTSMKEVRDMLNDYQGASGHFLLRKSFTRSTTLSVSVVHDGVIRHFNISQKGSGSFYLQDKLFGSIKDLVLYYKLHEVPNKERISGVHLVYPILDSKRHHFYDNPSTILPPESKYLGDVSHIPEVRHAREVERVMSNSQNSAAIRFSAKESGVKVTPGGNSKFVGVKNGVETERRRSNEDGRLLEDFPENGQGRLRLNCDMERKSSASWSPELSAFLRDQYLSPVVPNNGCRVSTRAPHNREFQYSYARSPYKEMASCLVQRLREIEEEDAIKCPCGVYHDEAELPRGWSFHRSTEPDTYGRVLFSGPDGEVSWNLPIGVSLELSVEQQDKIRELIHRPPRAFTASSSSELLHQTEDDINLRCSFSAAENNDDDAIGTMALPQTKRSETKVRLKDDI